MTTRLSSRPRRPGLWYGVGAGIFFWLVHINFMPALQPLSCHHDTNLLLHLLSVATAVPTLIAFLPSWHYFRVGETEGLRFMGALGLLLNAIFLLAILAEWAPVFVLDRCIS